jgi:aspartate/methionine/tyrosine aminotransferase
MRAASRNQSLSAYDAGARRKDGIASRLDACGMKLIDEVRMSGCDRLFPMKLEPFALERLQSVWEHKVAWNLAESGVHPLRVEELLDTAGTEALLRQPLVYTQTNGTAELRQAIASGYPGATPAHVLVTNGGSEANLVTLTALLQPGDGVVMMMPNYMQVAGLSRALGASVKPWTLVEDRGGAQRAARWRPDMDALRSLVDQRTRAILICNPNNPTGARLTEGELREISAIAAASGAWVVSDEIYRGAELDGIDTASAWNSGYERVIVTSGLS